MKRVLITGGTGFVGSHTVEKYLRAGWTVRALVRNPARISWLQNLPVEIASGALLDKDALCRAVTGCQCVVHCAGMTKAVDRNDLFKINRDAVELLAEAARDAGVLRFILCSSQAAAGPSRDGRAITEDAAPNPISDYGKSKLAGEKVLSDVAGKMEWVILRPSAVIGPRDEQFVPLFRGIVRFGLYPQFGSGKQLYSFVSVFDVANALFLAGERIEKTQGIYFVTYPDAVDWSDASLVIAELANRRVHRLTLPKALAHVVGTAADRMAKITKKPALLSSDKVKEILTEGWLCSPEKIMREWNFKFDYDLKRTIVETFHAYRNAGKL